MGGRQRNQGMHRVLDYATTTRRWERRGHSETSRKLTATSWMSACGTRFGSAVCRSLLLSQKTWITLSITHQHKMNASIAIDIACSKMVYIISSNLIIKYLNVLK